MGVAEAGAPSAFDVLKGGERPAIVALAEEARIRLAAALADLGDGQGALLAAMPLAWATSALERAARKPGLDGVSEGLRTIAARVRTDGRAWSETYARLLTYETLATLPTRTVPLNVPRIAWPDIETGLAAVLRDTAAGVFSDWDEEFFEKDIAVARVAVIGEVGRAGGIERWTPRYAAKSSPLGLKLKLAAYLRGDYFRKGNYWRRHQWRGYREVLRQPFNVAAEKVAATVLVNKQVDGMLGIGWVFDPALREVNPHFKDMPNGFAAMGGRGFYKPTDPLSFERAITTSQARRELYEAGKYRPIDYGLFVARRDVLRWVRGRNLDGRGAGASAAAAPTEQEQPAAT